MKPEKIAELPAPLSGPPPSSTRTRTRGRLTASQRRSLEVFAASWQVASDVVWASSFERPAPMGVEIGFGMGPALIEWAQTAPAMNLVGIEIYRPGIGALLGSIESAGLTNVRVLEGEASGLLETSFEAASIDEIRIFFPDPWPKRKHHKRRLIQPHMVAVIADRLKPGGRLWMATDWADYAQCMTRVVSGQSNLQAVDATDHRVPTRYESRGRRLGHRVFDLVYQRKV
ncbi:MAG: tRNA (guanosine(46)-N7)-methyltransferase TrmB [Proteobacteria bacterium]|nr:tRNA (guanosine(46)-N7)-methyltransferase TrmB [Pseudomonadota bacterium]